MQPIVYLGIEYRIYPDSKHLSDRTYYKCTRSKMRDDVYLHRQMWIDAYGEIPDGYHIHHRDNNPDNNTLENFECLSPKEHMQQHPFSEERTEQQRIWMAEIRQLASAWHQSPEGRAMAKRLAHETNFGNWEPKEYVCEVCGIDFQSKKQANVRFCSEKCGAKWRRDSGLDDIVKPCELCGADFTSNRYDKVRFCSRSCARKHQHK